MTDQKSPQQETAQPEQPRKTEDPGQQSSRRRIKVQSDVRAGIVSGNGTLFP